MVWSLILLGIAGLISVSGASAGKIVSDYAGKPKNDGVERIFSDVTTLVGPATGGAVLPAGQAGTMSPFDAVVGLSSLPTGQAAVPEAGTMTESDITADAMPFTVTVPGADGVVRYRVQRGDTIATLAARFGITPETIRWANPSVGRTIRPGVDITIPPVSGVLYAVMAGDSLTTIGGRYGIDPVAIRQFNPRYQEILTEGSGSLVLPNAKPIAPAVKNKKK